MKLTDVPMIFYDLKDIKDEWEDEKGEIFGNSPWIKDLPDSPYYNITLNLCDKIIGVWYTK